MVELTPCPCCGSGVDAAGESVYPFGDGKVTQDEPVPNLFEIDADDRDGGGARGPAGWRRLSMCHACWHRLEGDDGPDQWTTRAAWDAMNPSTPYDRMPPAGG